MFLVVVESSLSKSEEFDYDDSDKDMDWIPQPTALSSEGSLGIRSLSTSSNDRIVQDVIDGVTDNNISILNKKTHISRKRLRNEHKWKRVILKSKKNSGQAYTTTKGCHFNEKHLCSPCSNKCRYKCTTHFTDISRESLLKSFWEMADITRQRAYIVKCRYISCST